MQYSSKKDLRKFISMALVCLLTLSIMGCQAQENTQPEPATEVERLAKLCRVWGYVKYHHPAFLLGQKDWDEELLTLIPQVRELETDQEVNALLHDWFVSLGEIDYGTDKPVASWADAAEEDRLVITDTSWTTDAAYLGAELAGDLGQLGEIPDIRRRKGPVFFADEYGMMTYPIFKRENEYPDMDYGDIRCRLLGLFRAWNILEYYFPYHDLTGEDWNEVLHSLIPSMLNKEQDWDEVPNMFISTRLTALGREDSGDDQRTYLAAMFKLFAHLHDIHVGISSGHPVTASPRSGASVSFPFSVMEAEGQVVVSDSAENCPLETGDILIRVNGLDLKEYLQVLEPYLPCSREEVYLSRYPAPLIFYYMGGDQEQVEVVVLRDGKEETFLCDWTSEQSTNDAPLEPYLLLDGNVGLINPESILYAQSEEAMTALRDTDGLVIDLRQYPWSGGLIGFSSYFTTECAPVFIDTSPSIAVPGAYVKKVYSDGYRPEVADPGRYYYDKPVVVLINEYTQSAGERSAWIISKGENVVLMGQNTAGALNRITDIPIPGGFWLSFTAVRAELDDGSQFQRVGLTPDIPVSRTIQGIKEGRDELMEAAVAYIREAA